MTVSAIWLFGSRARNQQSRGSDTDLLLVGSEDSTRHVSIGHLSMFFYTWAKLLSDAQSGNLFTCHIVREAVPIYDSDGILNTLRENFTLRRSYATEIQQASDLGWFLDRYGSLLHTTNVARRMIWCIRTILIARSAEAGTPVFSPDALMELTQSSAARDLLTERHQRHADAAMRHKFRIFLRDEAMHLPGSDQWSVAQYEARFRSTQNAVALRALRATRFTENENPYCA
ncbi:MAG: nucleotidyltransferase domain-containing protein [Oxalobacteraceae bacterium]|nr:MAG: nucleotidyltransferase domain-containing protein [Oxalobacteraceae bacterium]